MSKQNDRSSQVKKSNQEDKSHAALQLLSEFISNFNDPDPKINRDVLSELLTVGFRERPSQDDPNYSKTAGRLSEAVRELLNGIIDNGLDDKIGFSNSGQAESGSFLFDYSGLDSFFHQEVEPVSLAKGFTDLHCGFTLLLAQAMYEGDCHNIPFYVPENTISLLRQLIELFEIIRELEEVKS